MTLHSLCCLSVHECLHRSPNHIIQGMDMPYLVSTPAVFHCKNFAITHRPMAPFVAVCALNQRKPPQTAEASNGQ
jgi:hypothetical protein